MCSTSCESCGVGSKDGASPPAATRWCSHTGLGPPSGVIGKFQKGPAENATFKHGDALVRVDVW